MDPSRFVLTDRQWLAIEPLCPGGLTAPGRTGSDTRLFLEAVLWIVRTDAPWRDLPPEFGNWNSTFRRFTDNATYSNVDGESRALVVRCLAPMARRIEQAMSANERSRAASALRASLQSAEAREPCDSHNGRSSWKGGS